MQIHVLSSKTRKYRKSIHRDKLNSKMSLQVTGSEKDNLVASLAALVAGDECTAETLTAVVEASGNKIPAYYAPLFATYVEKAGGLSKIYGKGPTAGCAAAPAAGAAAAVAAPAAAKPVVEEVDALEGGMNMFGGGDGGDY